MNMVSFLGRPICCSLLAVLPMCGVALAAEPVAGCRVLVDGRAVHEGDVLPGRHERILPEGVDGSSAGTHDGKGRRAKRAVYKTQHARWPDNTVYYEFSSEVERPLWEGMQAAMRHIEANTGVRFVADASQPYRLIITPVAASAADRVCGTSYIGRQAPGLQPQRLTITCEKPMTYLHELMHALGFGHERDRSLPGVEVIGGEDPRSVMHWALTNVDTLSAGDIAGINAYYPRALRPQAAGVHPPYPGPDLLPGPEAGVPRAYQLKNRHDKACLSLDEMPGPPSGHVPAVTLRPCVSGKAAQQWRYLPDGRIQHDENRQLCLAMDEGEQGGELRGVAARECHAITSRWSAINGLVYVRGRSATKLHSFSGRLVVGRPAAVEGIGVRWSWLKPAGAVADPVVLPTPVSPFGKAAAPQAPSAGRQLYSLADRQCLTVRQDSPALAMHPCDSRRSAQRWRQQADGRIASVARPGTCLGKMPAPSEPAGSGRGYAVLHACNASSALVWQFNAGRLQDLRFPAVGLSNFNGSLLVDIVFPQRREWAQWQWR